MYTLSDIKLSPQLHGFGRPTYYYMNERARNRKYKTFDQEKVFHSISRPSLLYVLTK